MLLSRTIALALAAASFTNAHTAAWAPGMYCRGGNDNTKPDNNNNNMPVNPLYMLSKKDFWFQHYQGCDQAPPPPGEFLELPANGQFTVELAHNRAFTTLSYDGKFMTDWPDGKEHPENWTGWTGDSEGCIQDDGALHVQNETSATGTAFAISYQSDLSKVTLENLAVFTVLKHTPWKRLATYKVPNLPACPPEGCTCAWLWVPKGCGQPNVYMQGFKCRVTGATSTTPVAAAIAPVYCPGDASKCGKGAKQMIVWNQAEGNNVKPPSFVSPGYNEAWGYKDGAQSDIFVPGGSVPSGIATNIKVVSTPSPSPSPSSTKVVSSQVLPVSSKPTSSRPSTSSSSIPNGSSLRSSASTFSTSFVPKPSSTTSSASSGPASTSPLPPLSPPVPAELRDPQFWAAFYEFLNRYFSKSG